jgi:hypothetical protein
LLLREPVRELLLLRVELLPREAVVRPVDFSDDLHWLDCERAEVLEVDSFIMFKFFN